MFLMSQYCIMRLTASRFPKWTALPIYLSVIRITSFGAHTLLQLSTHYFIKVSKLRTDHLQMRNEALRATKLQLLSAFWSLFTYDSPVSTQLKSTQLQEFYPYSSIFFWDFEFPELTEKSLSYNKDSDLMKLKLFYSKYRKLKSETKN